MHIEEATWTELNETETNLALLPIGSTEQHGPHAPMATDTLNAEAIATEAAERYTDPVVVAPSVSVSIAEEHRYFTGTLWTDESTFRNYIRDIVTSLSFHGWDRVVLVNGHGGNVDALREVSGRITRHDDAFAVPFTWFNEIGDHGSGMGHGGPIETALLRHTSPDVVHEDRLEEAANGAGDRWGEWQGNVNLAFDSDEFTENGVVGDPRDGDADLGSELLNTAADSLTELLSVLANREIQR